MAQWLGTHPSSSAWQVASSDPEAFVILLSACLTPIDYAHQFEIEPLVLTGLDKRNNEAGGFHQGFIPISGGHQRAIQI